MGRGCWSRLEFERFRVRVWVIQASFSRDLTTLSTRLWVMVSFRLERIRSTSPLQVFPVSKYRFGDEGMGCEIVNGFDVFP